MQRRRFLVSGVGATLLCLTLAANLPAADLTPAQLLPASTVFYAELPQPGAIVATLIDHPLRSRIESLPEVQAAKQKKEYIAFQAGREYVESQLGMNWREAIDGLTAHGVAIAFDPETQGVALLVRARDEATLTHIRDVAMSLARADARNKGQDDPYKSNEYRGVTVYQTKQGGFATVGDQLVVVNKGDLGKAILDRLLDKSGEGSLASQARFQDADATRSGDVAAWSWVDVDWARREADKNGKPFQKQTDNPVAELLVGGLLDTFQHTPWLTGAVHFHASHASLRLRTPHLPEWITEARQFFFGPGGTGVAPNAPVLDQTLFTLSTYRNLSELWLRAGDLFPENVVDKFAEADGTLTLFFSGRDFGEDILGAFEPTMQIIATRQSYPDNKPTPSIKLPAFALLFEMKDPVQTTRDLKRVFTSFIGFVNITGAQEGNPQLELSMPAVEGYEVASSQFLPRVGEELSREAQVHFNFSPTVAFVGKQFILASSEGLAHDVATADTWVHSHTPTNTSLSLNGPLLQSVLADNQEHLIAKNMLEEGHTRPEAERAIGLLLKALTLLDHVSIDLTNGDGQVGLDLNLQLRPEAFSK